MQRREFIKSAALVTAAAAVHANAQGIQRPESPDMIYRMLGSTGERVSAIGLGGGHIGYSGDEATATRVMLAAIDGGITFFDNCVDYNGGRSEERMGKVLAESSRRQRVFLMTKSDSHSAEGWNANLELSLKRLRTDMIDLVQFHEVIRPSDPKAIFARGGAIEAAIAAREAGKIRYIGFTGHKDPGIHLRMIKTADKHGFHFDTVQMPINILDAHFRSFQQRVMPVANAKGIGVLAMKTFAFGEIVKAKIADPIDILHYSLSLPVSVVITGMPQMPILQQALTAAKTFRPMTQEQVDDILYKSKDFAADGRLEQFKTSTMFDGTTQHPEWLT